MILIVSSGGNDARSLSQRLSNEKIDSICLYPTLDDAGVYGNGHVIVGELTRQTLCDIIKKNRVYQVVDVMSGLSPDGSLLIMGICKQLGCKYFKYLRPPVDCSAFDNVFWCDSYSKIVEAVNRNIGNVVLYMEPRNVNVVAGRVLDKSCLYAPIPREVSFNVDLALQYGLNLTNVIEVDSPEEEESVAHVIEKYEADFLVCDSGSNIAEKARAAKRAGINILLTQRMGIDYTAVAESFDQMIEYVKKERGTETVENNKSSD